MSNDYEREQAASGDEVRHCVECGDEFVITVGEQDYFERLGLNQPKRCKRCRAARRQAKQAEAEGGGVTVHEAPRVDRGR